jgi:hypothetical protein
MAAKLQLHGKTREMPRVAHSRPPGEFAGRYGDKASHVKRSFDSVDCFGL